MTWKELPAVNAMASDSGRWNRKPTVAIGADLIFELQPVRAQLTSQDSSLGPWFLVAEGLLHASSAYHLR